MNLELFLNITILKVVWFWSDSKKFSLKCSWDLHSSLTILFLHEFVRWNVAGGGYMEVEDMLHNWRHLNLSALWIKWPSGELTHHYSIDIVARYIQQLFHFMVSDRNNRSVVQIAIIWVLTTFQHINSFDTQHLVTSDGYALEWLVWGLQWLDV